VRRLTRGGLAPWLGPAPAFAAGAGDAGDSRIFLPTGFDGVVDAEGAGEVEIEQPARFRTLLSSVVISMFSSAGMAVGVRCRIHFVQTACMRCQRNSRSRMTRSRRRQLAVRAAACVSLCSFWRATLRLCRELPAASDALQPGAGGVATRSAALAQPGAFAGPDRTRTAAGSPAAGRGSLNVTPCHVRLQRPSSFASLISCRSPRSSRLL
jgi:hypothetical protein